MRITSAIVLAASVVALSAVHAADKAARPTEVHGVKLSSICIDCAVVSDVRTENVNLKKSKKTAAGGAPASGAASGSEGDAKTTTVWSTTVVFRGGTTQTYQQRRNPGLHPGDVVIVQEGVPRKYVN
jgi:hypothetical protein